MCPYVLFAQFHNPKEDLRQWSIIPSVLTDRDASVSASPDLNN
jgi:hypothetical protein